MKSKPKILCVDDESEITLSLTRLLSSDFEVLTAFSVKTASDLMDQHKDLAIVLTDHRLPGGTGLDVLALAQTKCPETVRAMLSAHVDIEDIAEAINKSLVHRLILKPWDNDYLRVQMFECVRIHEVFKEKFELQRLAITDPVTLLRNHRFFQDQLKIEVARAVRHQRDLSLIMLDIDRFKDFNDQHGHPAGDRLLRAVGVRLTEAVRNLDTVARYGGEEFAIILPDTPIDRAQLVAERVRAMFASNPFIISSDHSTLVTVSIGIASVPAHAQSPTDLVQIADAALYRAKGQGRNQSVVGTGLTP